MTSKTMTAGPTNATNVTTDAEHYDVPYGNSETVITLEHEPQT